ncbi:HlyD family efflux transporter periplasmic adaptor subunit [Cyanobacteria bacterium FACHB-472]|nr:HlyD family efflux transporter periplasmic adaptor subunit [Cyanobacteria bacterium FACHB-472]
MRSPASGTILQLNLRNGGQVVREAELIAKIAPSNTTLVVKARDRLEDVGKVAVGQQVQMRSTYPYPDYGTLKGK